MSLGHRIVLLGATAILLVAGIGGAALVAAGRGDQVRREALGDRRQLEAVYEMAIAARELRRAHRIGSATDAAAAEAQLHDELAIYRAMHEHESDDPSADEELAFADTIEASVASAHGKALGSPAAHATLQDLIGHIDVALQREKRELGHLVEDAAGLVSGVRRVGVAVPPVAVLVIVLLSAGLLLPLRRRVRELEAGAERFARGEAAEIPDLGNDELARLARAWNAMHRELRKTTVSRAELEKNLAALQEARAQLVVADRLALVGTLAAGVAHEINNPLAYLGANLGWIRGELERGGRHEPALVAAIAEAEDGAARIASIVSDLRTFSREDETRTEVDLRQVVEDAIRLAGHEVRHAARLDRELAAVPGVIGNRMRLGQVVLNLVVNAAQAFPGGAEVPRIVVRTRRDEAGNAVVEVEDNGAGVPEEIRHRIFDPFFSTKPVGVGTGLGLSVCTGIVGAHGGTLAHEHRQGGGSVFRVTIPGIAAARAA